VASPSFQHARLLTQIPGRIRRAVTRFFTSGARARLRWFLYALLITASFALMIIIPLLKSDTLTTTKVEDAVQTGVVVLALTVAVATYLSNSRNKRIEQVYDFHKEMTTGEIGEARRRLLRLIYSQQRASLPPLREINRSEVRDGGALASYGKDTKYDPDTDWTLVIRFYQRAWNARRRGSFDDLTVVNLIGRSACWWDLALNTFNHEQDKARLALSQFAQWTNRYQEEHPDEPQLADWGGQRKSEFGRSKRDPLPLPGGRRLSWFRRDITD
jgi:hypothetical protein